MAPVVLGTSRVRDRDEQEVRGYREALRLIHEQGRTLATSEKTIRELHARSRARVGDAGDYRTTASDIIERYPDGRTRVRFRAIPPPQIPAAMRLRRKTSASRQK